MERLSGQVSSEGMCTSSVSWVEAMKRSGKTDIEAEPSAMISIAVRDIVFKLDDNLRQVVRLLLDHTSNINLAVMKENRYAYTHGRY